MLKYISLISIIIFNSCHFINSMDTQESINLYFQKNKTEEILGYLSSGSLDLNYRNKSGDSLLHYAIYWNNFEVCKYLLENIDFNINAANKDKVTPLMQAIRQFNCFTYGLEDIWIDYYPLVYNKKDVLNLFFSRQDLNINLVDKYGKSCLHYAVEFNDKESLSYILNRGDINLNLQDHLGNTALHYAVNKNNLNFIKLLVARAIDVNIKNKFGRTARDLINNRLENKNCLVPEFVNNLINRDYITALTILKVTN